MSYAQYCRLNLHVGASDLEVVRKAQSRLAWPEAFTGKARYARKAFYRSMLKEHRDARKLFNDMRF